MNRGRALILTLALCGLALVVLPAAALARTAIYTGAGELEPERFSPYAAPVELATGALGTPIPTGIEQAPADVAITPNGSTAYATSEGAELIPIEVATGTEGSPISTTPGSLQPLAIAISPVGKFAYTANAFYESVSVIDLTSGTEVKTIPVSGSPDGIAVTPDGTRAYVSGQSENKVFVLDLNSDTVIGSIEVGEAPKGIAVTPDGKHVYVVNRISHTVSEIDTATNTVVATIETGISTGEETQIAIAPNGSRAYVIGRTEYPAPEESWVTPIDLATATAGTPIAFSGRAGDIAILPAGNRAYITHFKEPSQVIPSGVQASAFPGTVNELLPLNLATNALEAGIETHEFPEALAIVPNQPPHAVIEGPGTATAGDEVSLDGSKSFDTDGTVARYDWSFGDGTSAANGGPTVHHTYANPGTYQVTLTTTDNEGCSTERIFTGQTAYCNGSEVARTTHQVVVSAPATTSTPTTTTPTTIARCVAVVGKAGSFVPKIRPGHIVPGVRVRLAVGTPSRLQVKAKLLWSVKGKKGSAKLHGLSVKVNRWRRVRFAIPAKLRGLLPLHTRVTLKLAIRTTPLSGPACSGATTYKTLHLRVVKVFPNAVQAH